MAHYVLTYVCQLAASLGKGNQASRGEGRKEIIPPEGEGEREIMPPEGEGEREIMPPEGEEGMK